MTDFEVDAFFAIAEMQSITVAADSLGITQSALSRRILALEESLGYQLIIHQKGVRNIQLTEYGKKFYSIAQKWKLLWEEAKALPTSKTTKTLRIASPDSINSYIMPVVYEKFSKANPDVHLICSTFLSRDRVTAVETGNLDVGLCARTPQYSPLVDIEQLYTEPLRLVCGLDAPYEDGIIPSDLDSEKEICVMSTSDFRSWHSFWFPNNDPPRYYLDKFSFYGTFPLMSDNWAFVPTTVAKNVVRRGNGRLVECKNPPPSRVVYYATQNKPKSDELIEFIRCLKEAVIEIEGVNPFSETV